MRSPWPSLVIAAAASALAAHADAGLPSPLVEKWRWEGFVRDPDYPFPDTTPLVVQLTDDDGDGAIDADDVPDVAFLHTGLWVFGSTPAVLEALDGETGSTLFAVSTPEFGDFPGLIVAAMLAAGDLDHDGLVEFVVSDGPQLIAFQHDGTLAWTLPFVRPVHWSRPQLGIADLDQDGDAEVYNFDQVLSVDGVPAWASADTPGSLVAFSHAVDLAPDTPGLELLVGSKLYSATGTVLWDSAPLPRGATAVGDVDGDGDPEIALTAVSSLWLLDDAGQQLGPEIALGGGTLIFGPQVSEPTMADIDGDGRDEVVVPAQDRLEAHEWDGTGLSLKWAVPIRDVSCCSGATAFDFDDDGASEIVHRDELALRVLDGATGAVLHEHAMPSATGAERPVVADIDGDCDAEILATTTSGPSLEGPALIAYDVPGAATPRPAWNQHGYHVTNVADDGSIPRFESSPWASGHGWHAQRVDARAECLPCSIEVAPLGVTCPGASVQLEVDVTGDVLDVEWTSSCPGVTFHPSPGSLEPVALLPPTCGADCTLTVTVAGAGGSCTGSATVRVEDAEPPALSDAGPLFDIAAWPPNHGYVVLDVDALVDATDACGPVSVRALGCASSQPEEAGGGADANGDGRFLEDCVLSEDGSLFAVRAERAGACGRDSERVYTLTIEASDGCGNAAIASGVVRVAHDRRPREPIAPRPLPPHFPPPFPHVHATSYGPGCE